MTTEELTKVINVAYTAVNVSMAGPLRYPNILDQSGKPACNMVAMQTLQTVLQCILPKSTMTVENTTRMREPWEE